MALHMKTFLFIIITVFVTFNDCNAMIDSLYCGKENCYDVLGVTRDAAKSEIAKNYRQLARKYHPDKNKDAGAEEKFQAIATAYEILRDEDQRKDYDYMLDNPDEVYRHYYRYYRTRVAPKVDVRIVIAVSITVLSAIQAQDIAKKQGLLNDSVRKRGKRSKDAGAEEKFQAIATAYEILRDEDQRKDYDYMLDNPDEVYRHYYRYYRTRVAPKVDVRIVIAVSITVLSAIQYFSWWSRYNTAIKYLVTVPKYRLRAQDIAKKQGLLNDSVRKRGKRSKEAMREEEESILRQVVEENADIRGGYSKPKITDILWIQLILLPVTIAKYFYWYARWTWKFSIQREPYGLEEKHYVIRKNMGVTHLQYEGLEESDKAMFLKQELWIPENFKVYKQEKEEQMKANLAENSRYKSYRRYMKTHGKGSMTFQE
eukprot:XP_011665355.1 PREDICTED: dnaJ homolog subfamily C member 25 homolog [Strongylocentrotus purpuratus]